LCTLNNVKEEKFFILMEEKQNDKSKTKNEEIVFFRENYKIGIKNRKMRKNNDLLFVLL